MPLKKEESLREFKYKYNTIKKRLESAGVNVPKELIRDNLLSIINQRFPKYFVVYDSNKSITNDGLLDALEGLQLQAQASSDSKSLKSEDLDLS